MAKRLVLTLLVVIAVVGGLGFAKYRQVEAAIAVGASFQPPPTAVTTVTAHKETWPSTLSLIGTAAAIQGVTVSADLPGTIEYLNRLSDALFVMTRHENKNRGAPDVLWDSRA